MEKKAKKNNKSNKYIRFFYSDSESSKKVRIWNNDTRKPQSVILFYDFCLIIITQGSTLPKPGNIACIVFNIELVWPKCYKR